MADPQKKRNIALDREAFEFLAELVQDFGSTLDVDQLLKDTCRGFARHVDFDTFAVLLLDSLGRELYFRFGDGFTEEVVSNWRFGLGQGVVGAVAASQQPVRIGDVRADDRYIGAASRVRSELAVPLIVKNRVIGVLDVASNRPDHFTDSDQQLLIFVASHLGNAIENARLYESVRDQARTLSLLHESSRKLASILDREKLLHKVGEMVKRLVDYQLFSVMLWNEDTQLLEHTFAMGFHDGFRRKGGFPLGHGVTGNCAALRRSMRVPNVHLNPHYTDCGHGVEVRSELAVPLVFKDRLIGVLDLESTEYNSFTEQHEQMLSTLASYIAVALENARLYERLAEDERRLESDLETAREMQSGLLPSRAPAVSGLDVGYAYKPARQLGGDFYDFLPYADGRHAFAVGDVAGKGTPAALYASLAVGIVRGHIVEHPCEPEEMLADTNRQLLSHRIDNRFVAMAFALYDPATHELLVANGGLPRPLLVRDGTVEDLPAEGVPLGMLGEVDYEQTRVALKPGDVVVISSDGVCESASPSHEEFGKRKLQARLIELASRPAAEIATELILASEQFVGDSGHEPDDRTVVILRRS